MAGAFGLASRGASANAPTDPVDCTMPLLSRVALGKNKGTRYDGDLAITIETNGAIDTGQLTTADGATFDVVGQADGRTINLRIKIASDEFLSLIGTGEQDLTDCSGRVDGTFGGWAESDLGTWTLGVKPAVAGPTPPATIASGNGGGSNGGNSGGGNGSNGGGGGGGSSTNPTPTPTPCPPQDCGGILIWMPDLCACGCADNGVACEQMSCCPTDSICANNGTGNCACASGSEVCGNACVPSDCAAGSTFNYSSCLCETATSCGSGETLCASSGTCVSIVCPTGQLFDAASCMCVNQCSSGMGLCGGVCISISTDQNCGACGNVCPTGQSCFGNYCGCPATYHYDTTAMKCFMDCISGYHNDSFGTCIKDT